MSGKTRVSIDSIRFLHIVPPPTLAIGGKFCSWYCGREGKETIREDREEEQPGASIYYGNKCKQTIKKNVPTSQFFFA